MKRDLLVPRARFDSDAFVHQELLHYLRVLRTVGGGGDGRKERRAAAGVESVDVHTCVAQQRVDDGGLCKQYKGLTYELLVRHM